MVLILDRAGPHHASGHMTEIPSPQGKIPWYLKTRSIVIAFLCVGPLALPLVWMTPTMTRSKKIIWTVVSLVSSYFLYVWTMDAFKKFEETYAQLKSMM